MYCIYCIKIFLKFCKLQKYQQLPELCVDRNAPNRYIFGQNYYVIE